MGIPISLILAYAHAPETPLKRGKFPDLTGARRKPQDSARRPGHKDADAHQNASSNAPTGSWTHPHPDAAPPPPGQSTGPSCAVSSGTERRCARLIVVILGCLSGLLHQVTSEVSWNPTWSAVNGNNMRNGNVNCVAAWTCNKFY